MSNLTGMERFSNLEDKIYRTVEYVKHIREEKDRLERETISLRNQMASFGDEKARLERRIEALMNERDAVQLKVESMLENITILEPEVAEVLQG